MRITNYGKCPHCLLSQRLRMNGTVGSHVSWGYASGQWGSMPCKGTGMFPKYEPACPCEKPYTDAQGTSGVRTIPDPNCEKHSMPGLQAAKTFIEKLLLLGRPDVKEWLKEMADLANR